MTRVCVVSAAAIGAALAALPGIVWPPAAWVGWVVLLLEVSAAVAVAWGTYTQHAAAVALSWRFGRALAGLDGVILWAVQGDGTIDWSVGGALRRHWPEIAPDGVQVRDMHLRHFGDVPERDDGLDRAWQEGRSVWVVPVAGVTWLSIARRVGSRVVVLTVDASMVAVLTRDRLIASALGE